MAVAAISGRISFLLIWFLLLMNATLISSDTSKQYFSNETDWLSLLHFKDQIIRDAPLHSLISWNGTLHFCQWKGVTCGRRHPQRVTALDLRGFNLAGRISSHIGNLTFLRRIDLSNNALHDPIPGELGRLFRLQYLLLKNNSLSGEIPVNLSHCSQLTVLDFERNKLVGSIPAELGYLSRLSSLDLGLNNLVGKIPASLGNLSSDLGNLYLGDNGLNGNIPAELGKLTSLEWFSVSSNDLSGTIPSSMFNISAIRSFGVMGNRLRGSLPPQLGFALPNLRWLSVARNQFSGPIPVSLPNATYLETVQLQFNHFSGSVPNNLGSLQYLQWVNIGVNELGSGKAQDLGFLDSLTNCSMLTHLAISNNRLGGDIPPSISNLSKSLNRLNMGDNTIIGNIPSGIGELNSLTLLDLGENMLTGAIPTTIGKLDKMVELFLVGNKLAGEIPTSVCNMTILSVLGLEVNELEGSIPSCLEMSSQLQFVFLSSNKLGGTLPQQIFCLASLIDFHLHNNFLSGSLPFKMCRLCTLQTLDVSNNNFSGEIPTSLGDCLGLENLNLSGNLFQGSLPITMGSLKGLRYLDLSSNHLSGGIPNYLEKLPLEYLNLSFNNFEGELPKEGAFKNSTAISVIGNSKLCGGIQDLQLPLCIRKSTKKSKISHATKVKVVIIVVTMVGIALSCFFISLLWLKRSKKKTFPPSSLEGSFFEVSYDELLRATDGFSSTNLIGSGSYGSVYKGLIHRIGSIVAVKVVNLLQQGATKSFMAECEALKNIRHRNLVKILTCCSSIDFNGNDFKALVFEYMPNESLDKWLHKDEDGIGRNLKLIQRLNIAIDVACALDYLHHHCQTPIVHCDLKPSNVLLDADMVAHVTDFGLARFMYVVAHSSSIGVKGSIGYIAPEYAMGANASPQGDIYSYGILLLEMITGKNPTDDMFQDNITIHLFVKHALQDPDGVTRIADPHLLLEGGTSQLPENKVHKCLSSMAKIGVMCSAEFPEQRMEMNQVIGQLHAIRKSYIGPEVYPHTQTRAKILGEGSSSLRNY